MRIIEKRNGPISFLKNHDSNEKPYDFLHVFKKTWLPIYDFELFPF